MYQIYLFHWIKTRQVFLEVHRFRLSDYFCRLMSKLKYFLNPKTCPITKFHVNPENNVFISNGNANNKKM